MPFTNPRGNRGTLCCELPDVEMCDVHGIWTGFHMDQLQPDIEHRKTHKRASDRHDSNDDLPEKIPRPDIQGTLVHNEGGDFPARLFYIEVIYGLPQEALESVWSQRFVIPVIAGLTHPGFEVSDPNLRIPARVPYQVVPVAPLHGDIIKSCV